MSKEQEEMLDLDEVMKIVAEKRLNGEQLTKADFNKLMDRVPDSPPYRFDGSGDWVELSPPTDIPATGHTYTITATNTTGPLYVDIMGQTSDGFWRKIKNTLFGR